MNENSRIKEYELLLNLLGKAEEILSIINLSDSSISKYNTLKQMIFEKLNIEFKPLEKKYIPSSNTQNQPTKNDNNINNNDILYTLYFLNIKKSLLIDLILNYLNNCNNVVDQEKDLNFFVSSLTEIYNLPMDSQNSKNVDNIEYDVKMENSKLAGLFTRIDQVFMNNFDIVKKMKINYENEINKLRENYSRDLSELKICVEKNSNLECDFFKIRKENEKICFYLNKMSVLINESYEKYKNILPNENNDKNIPSYYNGTFDEDIFKFEFLKNLLDKLFENISDDNITNNNNNIPNLKRNNIYFDENYNYQNIRNKENNELIKDINNNLPEIQKESDIFHKNFTDLMNYIEENIEGKII